MANASRAPTGGGPAAAGSEGTIFIDFLTETSATLTLPGGRTTAIQPFNFGYGNPPQSLFGEWVYVYDIIPGATTFAERFDYTTVIPGTSNGIGIATDPTRIAGCEYQVTGPPDLIGHVLCVDGDAAGNLTNIYLWQFGLGETFDGFWVSPTTNRQYPMKGFRVKSNIGNPRAAIRTTATQSLTGEKQLAEARGTEIAAITPPNAEAIQMIAQQIHQKLLQSRE